ncbi:hypothetical protein KQH62_04780 [bacterium]|nr:hypothetical protein [bacterium]
MPRKKSIPIDRVAEILVGGKPLATHLRADRTLVVIGPTGKKFTFSAKAVAQARKAEREAEPGGES